jgi:hypothetical protein
VKGLAIFFASALAVAGVAGGAQAPTSYKLTAKLTTSAAMPKPTGVKPGARGTFTGTAVVSGAPYTYGRATLRWKLTFANLTGSARRAYIHRYHHSRGGPGKVIVPLCYPCRNGHTGTSSVSGQYMKLITAGKAYVNIHTARNQSGELWGDLEAVKVKAAP